MSQTPSRARASYRRTWLRIFVVGFVVWVTAVLVTLRTANTNLVPTLILLGSFLVPVTFVAWAFERYKDEHVTAELIVTAFLLGGLLGVLGASVLEAQLLEPSPLRFLGVGLIEEAVKLAALVLVARRLPWFHARDGFVLGGAVGFGFAAFETAGYAFNALLTVQGLSVTALVETELVRSVLAPFGHGLWTAVLGGVLFGAARSGRLRITGAVLLTYLWVSLLHAMWDYTHTLAVALTLLFTGTSWQYELLARGYVPQPTSEQIHVFTALSIGFLALVSLLGLATLWVTWGWAHRSELNAEALR